MEVKQADGGGPKVGRPHVQGYELDQAKVESLLPWAWVSERMLVGHNYWVGTTRPDGRPHAMPVWGVWLDEVFYFSTGRQSRKGRNLATRPEVVVHLESGDEVVVFEGTVEEFNDSAFFARFAEIYQAKYNFKPEPDPQNAYYRLNPRVVFAWKENDFVNSATRWEF